MLHEHLESVEREKSSLRREGELAKSGTIFKARVQHANQGKGTTRTKLYSTDFE
jgi:hypothetical protein